MILISALYINMADKSAHGCGGEPREAPSGAVGDALSYVGLAESATKIDSPV